MMQIWTPSKKIWISYCSWENRTLLWEKKDHISGLLLNAGYN